MMKPKTILTIGTASGAVAQRPSNVSICDYYSNALLHASNATTQYTLLTLLVNTAVIGNYTQPNKLAVPGILAQDATYNGTTVNLLPYFDGTLLSSNRGGSKGVAMNFLDGGGTEPLKMNKPANAMDTNQYKLLTHLYSYFGLLLGCSNVSSPGFPAYTGDTSMNSVHKFMDLDAYEVQYFIEQVGLSAASFGVATADVEYVGHALQSFFGFKCAPATAILPGESKELQSICVASYCPASRNATCKAYGKVSEPKSAASSDSSGSSGSNGSSGGSSGSSGSGGSGSGSGSSSGSATMPGVTATGRAAQLAMSFIGLAIMVISLGLMLG